MARLPENPRTHCYFGCEEGGPLHHFPKPDRAKERFDVWKGVLDDAIKIKGDAYIYNQLRLCNKHFENYYLSPSKCLTRNAVPTLYITSDTNSSSEAAEVSVEPAASVTMLEDMNSNMKQTFVEDSEYPEHSELEPELEMVKVCCVNGCKNESDADSGVSFHRFPTNQDMRAKWSEAVGFEPETKDTYVCSSHFKKIDFQPDTGKGGLQLLDYAVPQIAFCKICLSMDVKMHDMKNFDLKEIYQNITGIQVDDDSECLPKCVCWECANRLKAAAALREKALLSDRKLRSLLDIRETQITRKDIQSIKENCRILDSSLSIQKAFITTEIQDNAQIIPLKYIEISLPGNKNISNDGNNDKTIDPIPDIKEKAKKIKIESKSPYEIPRHDVQIENTEDVNQYIYETAKIPIINNNGNIILINKTVKKRILDEKEGIFKVEGVLKKFKNNMNNTVVIKSASVEGTIENFGSNTAEQGRNGVGEEREVPTTSIAEVNIERVKLKEATKAAPAKPIKVIKTKQKLNLNTSYIDESIRKQIILLKQDGVSVSEIARQLGTSRNTVAFWWKRWGQEGHIKHHVKSGPQRITTKEQDQRLIERVVEAQTIHTPTLAKELGVSARTVRNRLREAGLIFRERKYVEPQRSGRNHKVDEETKQRIILMKDNGVPVADIANQFRVTRTSVYLWWRRWHRENQINEQTSRNILDTTVERDQTLRRQDNEEISFNSPTSSVKSSKKTVWQALPNVE